MHGLHDFSDNGRTNIRPTLIVIEICFIFSQLQMYEFSTIQNLTDEIEKGALHGTKLGKRTVVCQ